MRNSYEVHAWDEKDKLLTSHRKHLSDAELIMCVSNALTDSPNLRYGGYEKWKSDSTGWHQPPAVFYWDIAGGSMREIPETIGYDYSTTGISIKKFGKAVLAIKKHRALNTTDYWFAHRGGNNPIEDYKPTPTPELFTIDGDGTIHWEFLPGLVAKFGNAEKEWPAVLANPDYYFPHAVTKFLGSNGGDENPVTALRESDDRLVRHPAANIANLVKAAHKRLPVHYA